METLRKKLQSLDGKPYKAYKTLRGSYIYPEFTLIIDHVQSDPFALATCIRLVLDTKQASLPGHLCQTEEQRTALSDFLNRAIRGAIHRYAKGKRGSGHSGIISIAGGEQQILQRNAVIINPHHNKGVEARIRVGLPANQRQIAARPALEIFFEELPNIVNASLRFENLDADLANAHVASVEDQNALRRWLYRENLAAFIADDALLPRASGVDDTPLSTSAQCISAPATLARNITLPHCGELRGLCIPTGVTLIVGGGFHGKSTLLKAIERGVYNHIPGDGRERVVTRANAVKVRAEDGRCINRVDISPFITNLPLEIDTRSFSTPNASGSTSQAANIIEAIETGADVLLLDEDTSASNFMIRDQRMQALVSDDKEPITPFLLRVRELYETHGISSVIVMGGSGDYFSVADTVIMMDNYQPRDVTAQARSLSAPLAKNPSHNGPGHHQQPSFSRRLRRRPALSDALSTDEKSGIKIRVPEAHVLLFGQLRINLHQVEQLLVDDQTRCIGLMMYHYATQERHRNEALMEALNRILTDAEQGGLDLFSPVKAGDLALPRRYELAAAINRIRDIEWFD